MLLNKRKYQTFKCQGELSLKIEILTKIFIFVACNEILKIQNTFLGWLFFDEKKRKVPNNPIEKDD